MSSRCALKLMPMSSSETYPWQAGPDHLGGVIRTRPREESDLLTLLDVGDERLMCTRRDVEQLRATARSCENGAGT